MGLYIDPKDMSKEKWLEKHSVTLLNNEQYTRDDVLRVCLVDNGLFTAAGVAYDEREFEAFTDPSDHRDKIWYTVPKEDLREVCGEMYDNYVLDIV